MQSNVVVLQCDYLTFQKQHEEFEGDQTSPSIRTQAQAQCEVWVGAARIGGGFTARENDISDQGEVTYRQDGDKNASGAKHTVANGVSVFGRVLDGLIVAVKTSAVRLNSAGLNDQERQAG